MIHAFTSSAPNYIGKVRVLCQSLREHCPDMVIHWLVADLRNEQLLDNVDDDSIDEVMFVDDLEACRDRGWLFRHDIVELSTAAKPEAALSLPAREDCDLLFYFDPDIAVFSHLGYLVDREYCAHPPHLEARDRDVGGARPRALCLAPRRLQPGILRRSRLSRG